MRLFVLLCSSCLLAITAPFINAQEDQVNQPAYLSYESAFSGFKSYTDPLLTDWYQANQTVREIGGWRTYMQEPFLKNKKKSQTDSGSSVTMEMQHHHHGGAQ